MLRRVEVFKYLGRLLTQHDDDAQAIRAQLVKARKCWARVGRVLKGENAAPKVCGAFYRAIVQSVLLFGSETWTISPAQLARLEGFHARAAWRMAKVNVPRRGPGHTWIYPSTADALAEVGLLTMEDYIKRRRQTIVAWVVDRPLFAACREGERKRGTPQHQWWWEQEMDLDGVCLVSDAPSDGSVSSADSDSWDGGVGG